MCNVMNASTVGNVTVPKMPAAFSALTLDVKVKGHPHVNAGSIRRMRAWAYPSFRPAQVLGSQGPFGHGRPASLSCGQTIAPQGSARVLTHEDDLAVAAACCQG